MKENKILYTIVIISLLFLSGTLTTAMITPNNTQDTNFSTKNSTAKWTVMMYCAFDNHRDAEKDFTFNTFKDVGSGEDFNIVSLLDTRKVGDTCYCYIEKDQIVPLPWYESESNMGHPDTLKRFVELTKFLYPADHYALFVMSTHGSGWQGLGGDTDGTGSSSYLSLLNMEDYKSVLIDVTNNGSEKLDVAAFEICITGNLEAAYQMAPYVNYMLSNEEHGFGGEDSYSEEGTLLEWNYSGFLNELKNNPDISPENFVKFVVNSYQAGTVTAKIFNRPAPCWYPIKKYYTGLAATNLSKIDILGDAVSKLAQNLTENLKEVKHEIKKVRQDTREYGKLYPRFWWLPTKITFAINMEPLGYDCFIDLYDFAEKLKNTTQNHKIKNACEIVMEAINTTVIANEALPTDPSNGLSIYFPKFHCQYDQSIWKGMNNEKFRNIPVKYEGLLFSQDATWDEFLKEYLRV